jgi:hypothetical protein
MRLWLAMLALLIAGPLGASTNCPYPNPLQRHGGATIYEGCAEDPITLVGVSGDYTTATGTCNTSVARVATWQPFRTILLAQFVIDSSNASFTPVTAAGWNSLAECDANQVDCANTRAHGSEVLWRVDNGSANYTFAVAAASVQDCSTGIIGFNGVDLTSPIATFGQFIAPDIHDGASATLLSPPSPLDAAPGGQAYTVYFATLNEETIDDCPPGTAALYSIPSPGTDGISNRACGAREGTIQASIQFPTSAFDGFHSMTVSLKD